jgi:ABC-type multidrug transport system ATPase subunit/pSer/pThr/pTyr-binding forkhead associated (FHA) protein
MNIILAEEKPGSQQVPEQEFQKGLILVGRDAFECDVAFEGERYPMVSRKHAELRWHEGKWLLIDLNSSYGTYLNGQRIAAPTQIATGNRLQFGQDGPVLKVVWFEVLAESGRAFAPAANVPPVQQQAAPPQKSVPEPPTVPPVAVAPPSASLERPGTNAQPLRIAKPVTWLGREPECDIVFDASSGTVSRRHASIKVAGADYLIVDNNSFNGTLVNEQRISGEVPLFDGDSIRLGLGGPVIKFVCSGRNAPAGAEFAAQRSAHSINIPADGSPKTVVLKLDKTPSALPKSGASQPQMLMSVAFDERNKIKIGRDKTNDIQLDGLQMSKFHAKITRSAADYFVEDSGSTNGVFVNGARITKQQVGPNDSIQIGSFLLKVDPSGSVNVFDTRSKTRVDCVNLTREVRSRFGGGKIKLLDGISLSIQPNEFVGLLGPSGAGKSSLIEALNGVRPANSGYVRINNLDLYRHLDSLKQAIGYVPQDDIIHRELTVYRTLFYVAKLRLSRDVSSKEISRMIEEVLDVTGLSERRNVPVSQLSGGQRKRVSIAVELVTKPSVIFLDEPTSGLDPATEDKIMRLFRQIAESGRTVIMTTHAMENVALFDKIVVLMRGKLVFFGKPEDALTHLNAKSFKELYDKLEEPAERSITEHGEANRHSITERTAEDWKQKYLKTPQFAQLIQKPLSELDALQKTGAGKKRRLGIFGSIRQWITLTRRYFEVLLKDKLNLAILFVQAPLIALLTFFVMGSNSPRDFVYFVLALVAIWFGTSVSAREIISERPVYNRERMFNLGILPYIFSKLFVLGFIVFLQCLMLFVPLKFFDLIGAMPMPGDYGGIPQFITMLLTAGVGIALGLLISAVFRTQEIATSIVPLILIPQILFSGLVGVPQGINKVIGMTMPAAWSFDTMKRYSTLETLEREGAVPGDGTKGLGLYKFIETENDKTLKKAEQDIADYKQMSGGADPVDEQGNPTPMAERLKVPEIKKLPDDLSKYVTFMHPWMHEIVNQLVLMLMFWMLVFVTLIVMRLKDIR